MSDRFIAAPDHPGWQEWCIGTPEQFNRAVLGRMLVRFEDDKVRVRLLEPAERHSNLNGVFHGGVLMAFIDTAMFAGANLLAGKPDQRGVTVDMHTQFLAPGSLEKPLDALVELTRETGKMFFTRGLLVQEDVTVCSFNGLVRKIS
ncbi:PaaI family thioesterase [Croceicoccus sediminis]|uniref:PaaI family thioesterase n=1 Tax=Croceicoccus sediminis TaxID=2571150 RepID=UPI0011839839|nr:PaaI family thioesterase [Croceicoccus sediminis]